MRKMTSMKVKLKMLREDAHVPTRESPYAGGYDLYSASDSVVIYPGESKLIGTGIALEIPYGYTGNIYARSGLALKRGLRPANCVGVIDTDYRGEVFVALYNDSHEAQTVNKGDRIAQIVFQAHAVADFIEADELSETERGAGGFGSTGV